MIKQNNALIDQGKIFIGKIGKVIKFSLLILISVSTLMHQTTLADSNTNPTKTWQIAEGVYRFGNAHGRNGYFSMFIVTDDGVIAIEPVNPVHAGGLMAAIKEVTDKPVRYLLHSHNHWDHSKGGAIFRDQGASIIAHTEAVEWMKANPHPDMVIPDVAWKGKQKILTLGEKTLELHHIGISHGLGMTVFVLREDRIAYIADVVTPNRVLFASVPDFNIKEWVRALKLIESFEFDSAVFAHTQSKEPLGTKKDVQLTREYIADIQTAIVNEFKKGTNFTEIPKRIQLPKYQHWAMYDSWLSLNVWRIMLDMHMGPYPWHPETAYEN